jgi:hypothetical protein
VHLISSELELFGIAFAYSGSTRWADTFLAIFQHSIADYEMINSTDPGFILFRLYCWKFIAWTETMRATWNAVCGNGSLLAVNGTRSNSGATEISPVFLRLSKEAVALIKAVETIKERCGSFELSHTTLGQSTAVRKSPLVR